MLGFLLQHYPSPFHRHHPSKFILHRKHWLDFKQVYHFWKCFVVFEKCWHLCFLKTVNFFLYEVGQVFSFVFLPYSLQRKPRKQTFRFLKPFSVYGIGLLYISNMASLKKYPFHPQGFYPFNCFSFWKSHLFVHAITTRHWIWKHSGHYDKGCLWQTLNQVQRTTLDTMGTLQKMVTLQPRSLRPM